MAVEVKTTTEYILDYAVPRAEEKLSAIADPEVQVKCLQKDELTSRMLNILQIVNHCSC